MIYEVFRFLTRDEAMRVVRELGKHQFADGKLTAQGQAKEVKNNLQIDRHNTVTADADTIIMDAFNKCQALHTFAMPLRFLMPTYSKYEPGMEYGAHVDGAMMGGFKGVRTDLAMTIFLSPPESYEGGELVLHLSSGRQEIKLDCGEAIVYSASSIHQVAAVKSGVRMAAITWIQSVVRDERMREILFDLLTAQKQVEASGDAKSLMLINKSCQNLIRYAAEP